MGYMTLSFHHAMSTATRSVKENHGHLSKRTTESCDCLKQTVILPCMIADSQDMIFLRKLMRGTVHELD